MMEDPGIVCTRSLNVEEGMDLVWRDRGTGVKTRVLKVNMNTDDRPCVCVYTVYVG